MAGMMRVLDVNQAAWRMLGVPDKRVLLDRLDGISRTSHSTCCGSS